LGGSGAKRLSGETCKPRRLPRRRRVHRAAARRERRGASRHEAVTGFASRGPCGILWPSSVRIGSHAMSNEATPADGTPPALARRLATILSADVAGYSRLMGEDEERTVQTLRGHRAVFDALLAQHHGRVFNTAGDAILAEFPSAVEAVRCATEIQAALQTRNEHLPPERRMLFRMGVNLGDVVVQQGDLLGDGVNVAARLQSIAAPA